MEYSPQDMDNCAEQFHSYQLGIIILNVDAVNPCAVLHVIGHPRGNNEIYCKFRICL